MATNKLVLKDGTEIVDGFASKSSRNQLMIHVPGDNLTEAAIMFSNASKTEEITCYHSIYKTIYKGFTIMYTVQYFDSENYIEIWLKPAEGKETSSEQEIVVPKEYVPLEVSEHA